jgi:Rps23 Pro-64 3,4-dihydroxylase Tpa1-like proline 4-hydroxylase
MMDKKVETAIALRTSNVPDDSKGTGYKSPQELEEFLDTEMANYDKAKTHLFNRAWKQESVRKPILRDSNGKAIGRGSFWFRKPFDYSDYERDLPQGDYDRIRSQDLTFSDRQRRVEADDISVSSTRGGPVRSDWDVRTGNYRTGDSYSINDPTFHKLTTAEMVKLYKSEHKWKHFSKCQLRHVALELKYRKVQAEKALQDKKKTLEDAKKRSRSHSRSKSTEPPATKLRAKETKTHE